MIEPLQALCLALLQGLTEFLPISSSAHLVIPSLLLDWPDQGLAFDVAVHVGTLSAVILYYRRDLWTMAAGTVSWARGNAEADDSAARLVFLLALATVPAGLAGIIAGDYIEAELRTLPVIATTTLSFALLMWYADRRPLETVRLTQIGFAVALLVGLAQALALVPGVSRSGVTITAALLLGLSRQDAARFSFLLSIPVIAGAGLLKGMDLYARPQAVDWFMLAGAAFVAAVTAYACIEIFLRWLDRIGLRPFVYYRLILALVLYLLCLS